MLNTRKGVTELQSSDQRKRTRLSDSYGQTESCYTSYSLFRVIRATEIPSSEAPWCFKLEHVDPKVSNKYFSASSPKEMKVGDRSFFYERKMGNFSWLSKMATMSLKGDLSVFK